MLRKLAAALILASWCATARAELDPETDKPYQLQVVLQVGEHRLLTDIFREQVRRELRDSLQAALGPLARVDVETKHPLLAEVEAKGLQHALDGWHFLAESSAKTHFVRIRFANGRYEIEARQYDGFTGLPSPVVRRASADDRQLVARNAALLIHQDFGLAGTIVKVEGEKVDVALKGAGLGLPLASLLKKGDIFAIAQISQAGGVLRSEREPGTLLQVLDEPQAGLCRCQLWHRWDAPLASGAGVLGYRCLKLGTTRAKVRLRLVANDKRTPVSSAQVKLSADGFQRTPLEQDVTRADGMFVSRQSYENVAFVSIFDGQGNLANIPVEVVEERTVSIAVKVSPGAERQTQFNLRRERWLHRVYDSMEVATNVVRQFNAAPGKAEAQKTAEEGLKALEADLKNLKEEHDDLKGEAEKLPPDSRPDLAQGEQHLLELQDLRKKLKDQEANLKKAVEAETDPKRLKLAELARQAFGLQENAEYDRAIALYKQVLEETEDANVREELDKLERAWKVKDQEHAKAREFIYRTWSQLDKVADLKSKLPKARDAFRVCSVAGDLLTPRMLLKANLAHARRLKREADTLQQDSEDDRELAKTMIALVDDLTKLSVEVEDYLKKGKADSK